MIYIVIYIMIYIMIYVMIYIMIYMKWQENIKELLKYRSTKLYEHLTKGY